MTKSFTYYTVRSIRAFLKDRGTRRVFVYSEDEKAYLETSKAAALKIFKGVGGATEHRSHLHADEPFSFYIG